MLYTLFQLIQTFCEQQIHWTCPLPCIAELCVWCVIGHHVLLISYDTARVAPLILFRSTLLMDRFHFLAQLFWGAPYIQKLLKCRNYGNVNLESSWHWVMNLPLQCKCDSAWLFISKLALGNTSLQCILDSAWHFVSRWALSDEFITVVYAWFCMTVHQ